MFTTLTLIFSISQNQSKYSNITTVNGIGFKGGVNPAPLPLLNIAQLTDKLLCSPHLAKVKGYAIYLTIIDSEIFLS